MSDPDAFPHGPELNDALARTRELAEARGLTDAFAFELFSLERRIDEALAWRQPTAALAALREAERLRDAFERQG